MTIIISANIPKKILQQINQYIPGSRRSKLLSQFIIDYLYELPTSKEELEEIIQWNKDEEMVIQPLFLAEEALHKIDGYLNQLKDSAMKYGIETEHLARSIMIRAITKEFAKYVRENPVEKQETKFVHIFMPAGTKAELDKHIDKMERSSTINQFILDEYVPKADVKTLKAALPEKREKLSVYLDTKTTLERVEEIANEYGQNVKKTHIIRDAVYGLIEQLKSVQPKKSDLEKTLERTLTEMYKHSDATEIKELLEKYLPDIEKK